MNTEIGGCVGHENSIVLRLYVILVCMKHVRTHGRCAVGGAPRSTQWRSLGNAEVDHGAFVFGNGKPTVHGCTSYRVVAEIGKSMLMLGVLLFNRYLWGSNAHSKPSPDMILFVWCVVVLGSVRSRADAAVSDGPLVQPIEVVSSNGVLDTVLTLEYSDFTTSSKFHMTNARLLNGTLPGPTLRLRAGDTLQIHLQNRLVHQPGAIQNGESRYKNPDTANLHFHGLHVSGELPSDDIAHQLAPGEDYHYTTTLPLDHMPGTHWLHPHVHGSTALHLGAGAAAVLIVDDPEGYLPEVVANAPEVVLMIQHFDWGQLRSVVRDLRDGMFQVSSSDGSSSIDEDEEFRMINGQYQPTFDMVANEWQRWRIVFGGWLKDALDLRLEDDMSSCTMVLLAKDGLYIRDFPRLVSVLPIPTAGRADVMVRCSFVDTVTVKDGLNNILFSVNVVDSATEPVDLPTDWVPPIPGYLRDLREETITEGCSCVTRMEQDEDCLTAEHCINNRPFDPDVYLHQVRFGSVVERTISDIHDHPYHQHVYPFQLVTDLGDSNRFEYREYQSDYFKPGDFHDVFMVEHNGRNGAVDIRYVADVHTGKIMIHCHRLTHEDRGMMAQELVVVEGDCSCLDDRSERCSSLFGFVSGTTMHFAALGACREFCAPVRWLAFFAEIGPC